MAASKNKQTQTQSQVYLPPLMFFVPVLGCAVVPISNFYVGPQNVCNNQIYQAEKRPIQRHRYRYTLNELKSYNPYRYYYSP